MNKHDLIAELRAQGIHNEDVLSAILDTPREAFVPQSVRPYAYENRPLLIGHDQTISQPYIVALMTELALNGKQHKKVLEIGTGSGYQASVLSRLFTQVYTIERIKGLYEPTKQLLNQLGHTNIHCLYDDGNNGWEEHSPYDAILVTSAVKTIPKALLKQLATNGHMIIPVGTDNAQNLQLIIKKTDDVITKDIIPVRFVPLMEGKA